MPVGEPYWIPYRFIPARAKVTRHAPNTDERFQGLSGKIEASLTNLTLLFIGGGSLGPSAFLERNHLPVIPGSSLKGMLRSLAEIVGGGCFVTDPSSCHNHRDLCITCRMFGMLSDKNVHKGQINISDGILQTEKPKRKEISILQGKPKKEHSAFYRHPVNGEVAKNIVKMYFHQPNRTTDVLPVPAPIQDRAKSKLMLLPGHTFDFSVNFKNLKEEEFNLLLYVLALEDEVKVSLKPEELEPIELQGSMHHKIGNGKAQGPGSCHIEIKKISIQDYTQRFSNFTPQTKLEWKDQILKQEIASRTAIFCQGQDDSPTMTHLRKMMVWDPNDNRTFRYPDYDWFQTPVNETVPLKRI